MVEAAIADVVSPAVAAEDPHVLAHQIIGELGEAGGVLALDLGNFRAQGLHALALFNDAGLVAHVGLEEFGHQLVANLRGQLGGQPGGLAGVLVQRQPHAHAELGIVLE